MTRDFDFADHANGFDEHIRRSIPGLDVLRRMVVDLSQTFVQPQTTVLDVGCSSGSMLRSIRDANVNARARVQYIGLDAQPAFGSDWERLAAPDLDFTAADARTCARLNNASLVVSLFTMQFIPEGDRIALLCRIHDGLIGGGALIIAEKILADTARFQDLFLGPYYDFKRRSFSAAQILDKERALRAGMRPWSESEMIDALATAGFDRVQIHKFWQSYLFIGLIAVKQSAGAPKVAGGLNLRAA